MEEFLDEEFETEGEYETAEEDEYITADEADIEFTTGKLFLQNKTVIRSFTKFSKTFELEGGYDTYDVIKNLVDLDKVAGDNYFKFQFVYQYASMEHPLTLTEKYCKIKTLLESLFKIKNYNDILDKETYRILENNRTSLDDEDNKAVLKLMQDEEIVRKYNITGEAIDAFSKEYLHYSMEQMDSINTGLTGEIIVEQPRFCQVYYESMILNLEGGKESYKIVIIENKLYQIYYPRSNNRCLILSLSKYCKNFKSMYEHFNRTVDNKTFKQLHYYEQIDIVKKLFKIDKEILLHTSVPNVIDNTKVNLIHQGRHVGIIEEFILKTDIPLQEEVKVKGFDDMNNVVLIGADFEWEWDRLFEDKTLEEVLQEAYDNDTTLIYAMANKPNLGIVYIYNGGKKTEIVVNSVYEALQAITNVRRTTKKNVYVYSHNGSLVENILFLDEIRNIHNDDTEFMLEIGNNAGNKIKSFTYNKITFIDSILYLQSSLDSAIKTYLPGSTKYHHSELDCKKCDYSSKCKSCSRLYFTKKWSIHNKEDVAYVTQDGKGLIDVLLKFNELVCSRLNIKAKWCLSKLSLASIAKNRLFELHPYIDTPYFQALMRPFYKGGDSQAHFIGVIKHISERKDDDSKNTLYYCDGIIISFDVVSMYPFIQSGLLPINPKIIYEIPEEPISTWCATVLFSQHVDSECMCNKYPIVDLFSNNHSRLLNPIIKNETIIQLWSFQYYRFKSCYTIHKIYYAFEFEMKPIYKDYVLSNFEQRRKVGTKTPEGINIKLMLNAATGTLGLKNERSTKVMSHKKSVKYGLLKNKLPRTITYNVGNFEWLQYREPKTVKTQLGIISFITATGRFMINMKKHEVFLEGNIPLQTDTDGLEFLKPNHTITNIEDQGEILGGQTIKKYSMLKIDGCKNYTYIVEGTYEERTKCKGKSLSIETWGRDCKTGEINIKLVPKKFTSLYNKGVVNDNGYVFPLII